jgi:hypothetical protein
LLEEIHVFPFRPFTPFFSGLDCLEILLLQILNSIRHGDDTTSLELYFSILDWLPIPDTSGNVEICLLQFEAE